MKTYLESIAHASHIRAIGFEELEGLWSNLDGLD
jgi:hypothetical protein